MGSSLKYLAAAAVIVAPLLASSCGRSDTRNNEAPEQEPSPDARPVWGQNIAPPYPGAAPLLGDEEFSRFQVLEASGAAGVHPDSAQRTVSLSSFVTQAPVDSVTDHLAIGAVETHRSTTDNPDSLLVNFITSLPAPRLEQLARVVGSDATGVAYRAALLEGLQDGPRKLAWHFVAHEHEDESLTYYDIHRPYFDLVMLQWVDATRIRVIHFPLANW